MIVAQCDWCKKVMAAAQNGLPANWLMLASRDPEATPGLFSPGMKSEAMLCTWVCLAEWAAARALISEGTDPTR